MLPTCSYFIYYIYIFFILLNFLIGLSFRIFFSENIFLFFGRGLKPRLILFKGQASLEVGSTVVPV